jgi:hypothetical protein
MAPAASLAACIQPMDNIETFRLQYQSICWRTCC